MIGTSDPQARSGSSNPPPAEGHGPPRRERGLLPRATTGSVRAALEVHPAVVVMGARQTGKTTLVRELLGLEEEGYAYASLDDLSVRAQAQEDPRGLVRRAPRLVLDEVQRADDVLLAVKAAIDEDRPRRPGRFLLTGSANLLLGSRVSETLAGRARYVTLHPLTRREQLGHGRTGIWDELLSTPSGDWYDLVRSEAASPEDWRSLARRGGYPTPAHELESTGARESWFRGYVQTYLERDLRDLAAIDRLVDFRRLMRAACLRLGQLTNLSELGRDVGLPQSTVHRYMNLLEASYQLTRIEPYSVNRTKRLIKSPKTYWSDTGLALHLSGRDEPEGAHLENLVFTDLNAWREIGEKGGATVGIADGTADATATGTAAGATDGTAKPAADILYWRTAGGQEVDFVIEAGERLLPIEVKATESPVPADARHLRSFLEEYPDLTDGGLLLHGGEETFRLAESVLAAPWWRVL